MGFDSLFSNVVRDGAASIARKPAAQKLAQAVETQAPAQLDAASLGAADQASPALLAGFNRKLAARFPDRLKLKYENMAKSPRRFFTGQPELYTYRKRALLGRPGPQAPLQGDMHMFNFGPMVRASGKVRIALNDFDEAYTGPVLFDLERMSTDITLAAKEAHLGPDQARRLVTNFADAYRSTLERLAKDPKQKLHLDVPAPLEKLIKHAKSADEKAFINKQAPLKHGKRALSPDGKDSLAVSKSQKRDLQAAFERYRANLSPDAARKLAGYRVTSAVQQVSGTGSMGVGRYRVLAEGDKGQDPMLFEFKEQTPPALAAYGQPAVPLGSEGARNVLISNAMDGKLDPFRGSATLAPSLALDTPSALVTRLSGQGGELDFTRLDHMGEFNDIATYYGALAAKAHAGGRAIGLASPSQLLADLPQGAELAKHLVTTGQQDALQVQRDYQDFVKALKKDPTLSRQTG